MRKNIVICVDGTGNEFTGPNSNVLKLFKALSETEDQVRYYRPGLGTMGARNALTSFAKWWTRVLGLAFGYGITDDVAAAYRYLMGRFEPGDHVFLFGFSRGAYAVRVLCGMLHLVGLLEEGQEELIPYAMRWIHGPNINFEVTNDFKQTFSRNCQPYFVGAWDTVSSVGWIYNPDRFPFTGAASNPDFYAIRHAMSIDERRSFYPSHSFGGRTITPQDVKEVWFAGVHSDVGGSYPECESQLSKISLKWMFDEAERYGLRVDLKRKATILGGEPRYVCPDPLTTNQHESLRSLWWAAEVLPHIALRPTPGGMWTPYLRFGLGRRRYIPSNSVIHESVEKRLNSNLVRYNPPNLRHPYRICRDGE
jgi:uncharacterized protein (DUF2235 family)